MMQMLPTEIRIIFTYASKIKTSCFEGCAPADNIRTDKFDGLQPEIHTQHVHQQHSFWFFV